jgi:hypothetical protein
VVFVMSHESERDFGAITLLFSVAPLSSVQLENRRVMLPKFRLDSLLITNPTLSATLGWVYDLSFPSDMSSAVVPRNVWYL